MKMRCFPLFVLFGVFLLLLLLSSMETQAGRGIEMFLHVDKSSAEAGELISGKVTARVYDGAAYLLTIHFNDGTELVLDVCADSENSPEGLTECDFNFIHVYDAARTYIIRVTAEGGPPGLIYPPFTGAQQTITITEKTGSGFATSIQPALEATTTAAIIRSAITVVYWIVSGLLVLIIVIGGYVILTSTGSPERVSQGRKIIVYAIIGFAIMVVSRGILEIIYLILGVNIP